MASFRIHAVNLYYSKLFNVLQRATITQDVSFFFRKIASSRRHQESLLAHQEFKFPANARICEDELRKGSIRWLADCCSRCVPDAHRGSFKNYRRPRPMLPAPLKESEGKKWKLPTGIVSSAEPPKPSKQEVLLESGLRNYITHCLRQI